MDPRTAPAQGPLEPRAAGHVWMSGRRLLLLGTGGPLPTPGYTDGERNPQVMLDWRAPVGKVRVVTDGELWAMSERRGGLWDAAVAEHGQSEALRIAMRGPGARLAEAAGVAGEGFFGFG